MHIPITLKPSSPTRTIKPTDTEKERDYALICCRMYIRRADLLSQHDLDERAYLAALYQYIQQYGFTAADLGILDKAHFDSVVAGAEQLPTSREKATFLDGRIDSIVQANKIT